MITEFIPGEACDKLKVKKHYENLVDEIKIMHQGKKASNSFNIYEHLDKYEKHVKTFHINLPKRFEYFKKKLSLFNDQDLSKNSVHTFCHNDLLPENFIRQNNEIFIIDFEMSGNNDPLFDLGNFWSEAELNEYDLEKIINRYYGKFLEENYIKSWKYGLFAKLTWCLWGTIQSHHSDKDFDFVKWSEQKLDCLENQLDSKIIKDFGIGF
jgi:thiamine kinase-like enzyme